MLPFCWDFVCMCMLHAFFYACMQKACNTRSCVCLHFSRTLHEFCRIFGKHYARKRNAKCVPYCSMSFVCILACSPVWICLHALVKTCCHFFWGMLYANSCIVCIFAHTSCMDMACKMRSCVCLHFACSMLHDL